MNGLLARATDGLVLVAIRQWELEVTRRYGFPLPGLTDGRGTFCGTPVNHMRVASSDLDLWMALWGRDLRFEGQVFVDVDCRQPTVSGSFSLAGPWKTFRTRRRRT